MIKQMFSVFIMAIFIMSLPAIVHADFANEIKLLALDGAAGASFGITVSISGDTAIIGAKDDDDNGNDSGSAYVFVRDPATGAWTQKQKLLASDGAVNDWFGRSVSISGDTAIVGAAETNMIGSAYVFVRNPATGIWTEQQKLTASDGYMWDNFSHAVSISGDTAVIGAIRVGQVGSAYIFERNPATGIWAEQQKLWAWDGVPVGGNFGISVSISGDTLISGAWYDDDNGSYSGSAYVFARDPVTGLWSQQQKLLAPDGSQSDHFGISVSISGDTAIIGADGDNGINGTFSGAAYVFVRDADTGIWTQQQKLLASDNVLYLGVSVSISGDMAVAGAYGDFETASYAGSATVFVRDPATGVWTSQPKLLASDGAAFDWFGRAVAISGETVIAGAYQDDDNGADSGSVYVYTPPDITVTDSVAPNDDLQVPFGDVTESTTADQIVTISNDGRANLTLGNIADTDSLATPFSIVSDNCSTQTLTPAANCTLTARFSPPSIGVFSDSFDIPSDDPNENPVTVSVSGTGIVLTVPDIIVTDSVAPVTDLAIDFGNVMEVTTSDQTITISNVGNADLVMGNLAMLDTLASPFSILVDNCSSQTLAAAASCTVTVQFAPVTTGAFSDSFDIPSNDPDEASVTFNLSGTGTSTPVADITVTDQIAPANDLQIPFTDLTVAGTSDQTVTITNEGNADLVIGNVAQTNVLAIPFSVVNDNCSGQTLAATASCTLVVRFAPTVAGIFNDSFDIPSNDPDESSVTVNVGATGLAAALNNPPASPGLVSPANGRQGLDSSVLLEWNPATDPDGDAVSYDVYNCTDSDPLNNCTRLTEVASLNQDMGVGVSYASLGLGGGMVILGITFAGSLRNRRQTVLLFAAIVISSLLASCGGGSGSGNDYKTYRVSGLDSGTTYYWAVVAKDSNGGETASAVWSYSTR